MAELDTITIKGFKSIASVEKLKLGPINVVIGPNGSGKSNFIGVFALLKAMRAGRLQDYAGKRGVGNLLHFGPKVTDAVQLGLAFHGDLRAPGHRNGLLDGRGTTRPATPRCPLGGREAPLSP